MAVSKPKDPANRKSNKPTYSTSDTSTKDIGQSVESMRLLAYNQRRIFERRWYDNNFFDDGFHFRYLSRTTNKVVDLSERSTVYTPQRAIPKASRQIRGIANLLVSQDPTPTVYPEEVVEVDMTKYPETQPQQGPDGQPLPTPQEQAKQVNDDIAKKRGWWLEEKWREPDPSGETMLEKLALMPLLSAKHGISYMQIWVDSNTEEIRSQVYDAFDIYVLGNYTSIYNCPFIIKATPLSIATIKANPNFDKDQLEKISPDNRMASSEIKEAYMAARFGRAINTDEEATLLLKEAFLKEYLDEDNMAQIRRQDNGDQILKDKEIGDQVIRQVFVAGNVWLRDEYLAISEYPFVEFRFEPGPLYGVPLIERFKDSNKSLDSAVSRIERYFHTMVTGTWLKRRGEQFKISNISGGQILEYEATPPTQAQPSSVPPFAFEFISMLTNFIEEQGVSTTTLGKLPSGVKSNAAIESLKESEYANLIIATRRLKETVRKIAVKMFELADENIVHQQQVSHSIRGKTQFFGVIGSGALSKRKKLQIETSGDLVPLSKDTKVDIEIESGMAYTKEGQKATMQQLIETLLQYVQAGAIPPEPVKIAIEKYLEVYAFGSTAEFMEAFDKSVGDMPKSEQQLTQIKMALLQALQDAGEVGDEASKRRVMENKFGALQALKDSGLAKNIQDAVPDNPELAPIPYKDAPEDINRQMEANAGLTPSQTISPTGTDQIQKHAQLQHDQQATEQKNAIEIAKLNQNASQSQSQTELQREALKQKGANEKTSNT